ncbi:hypothetical protein GCM10020295_07270 [Streptomyces cinereospinus]
MVQGLRPGQRRRRSARAAGDGVQRLPRGVEPAGPQPGAAEVGPEQGGEFRVRVPEVRRDVRGDRFRDPRRPFRPDG